MPPYPPTLPLVISPIKRPRKVIVLYLFLFCSFIAFGCNFVALLSVTTHMSKLQVVHFRRVPALRNRNDMVDCWRQWMRKLQALIHRLTAYPTYFLRCQHPLTVFFIGGAVLSRVVRPAVGCWHSSFLLNRLNTPPVYFFSLYF